MEFINKPMILLTKEEKEIIKNLAKAVSDYCDTRATCTNCPYTYDGLCGKGMFFSGLVKTSNYSET